MLVRANREVMRGRTASAKYHPLLKGLWRVGTTSKPKFMFIVCRDESANEHLNSCSSCPAPKGYGESAQRVNLNHVHRVQRQRPNEQTQIHVYRVRWQTVKEGGSLQDIERYLCKSDRDALPVPVLQSLCFQILEDCSSICFSPCLCWTLLL